MSDGGQLCCCHLELAELCLGQLSSANECQVPLQSVSLLFCPVLTLPSLNKLKHWGLQCRICAHMTPSVFIVLYAVRKHVCFICSVSGSLNLLSQDAINCVDWC